MKKTILISALFFALLANVFGSENNVSLTYRQRKNSRDLTVRLNSQNIAYQLTVKQNSDGYFTLQAPPFLSANIDDTLIIGELKDQGILALMLEPARVNSEPYRFEGNGLLKKVYNPSQNPTLSGIALCLDGYGIVALSPTMNPMTPLGMGMIAGNENSFAGFLYASQNDRYLESASTDFQANWSNLGIGRGMLFSIIGANADVRIYNIDITSSAFIQNAWDMLLGGGTSCGWDIKAETDTFTIRTSRRLGGIGVNIKTPTEKERPQETLKVDTVITSPENLKCGFEYSSSTYEVPIYGGQSQQRKIQWSIKTEIDGSELKAIHKTSYDKDRGKVSDTTYLFSTERDDITVKASVKLNRITTQKYYLSDATLEFSAPQATLEISSGKTSLEMSWEKTVGNLKIKVSVNQDRYLGISATFTGL